MPVNASGKNTSSTFLVSAEAAEGHRLLVLVAQREVRRFGADRQHQRRPGCPGFRLHQSARAPVAEVGRRCLHQAGRRRRFGDLGGQHVPGLAGLGGDDPDHAVVGQRRDGVHQPVDEVAVAVAPPQQHDVDDLVGVLVEQLTAARLLDVGPDVVVGVLVPAQLLHNLIFLDAQLSGVVRVVPIPGSLRSCPPSPAATTVGPPSAS